MDREEIKKEIGRRVQIARKKAGLTQQEFAERLDVSRSTVANWERGARIFEFEDLPRISNVLNIAPAYFIEFIQANNSENNI